MDPTSLQAARNELKKWNLLTTQAERDDQIDTWLKNFGTRLKNFNPLQTPADWPPLLLVYAWAAISTLLLFPSNLSKSQTRSLPEVWTQDFPTGLAEVDNTFEAFMGEFEEYMVSFRRLHDLLALEVELKLLGAYTPLFIKKYLRDGLSADDSMTAAKAVQGVLANLGHTLEGNRYVECDIIGQHRWNESAVAGYQKWEAAFSSVSGSLQRQARLGFRLPSSVAAISADESGVTAERRTGARSITPSHPSTSILFDHGSGVTFTHPSVDDLLRVASTVMQLFMTHLETQDF
jgi:hypothetical protein